MDFSQVQIDTTIPMTPKEGDVIIEIYDEADDGQVKGEKASPTGGETDGQTIVEGLTMSDALLA